MERRSVIVVAEEMSALPTMSTPGEGAVERRGPQSLPNPQEVVSEESLLMTQPNEADPRAASRRFLVLMADDDPEDCLLAAEAIQENRLGHEVHFVHDGEELLEYLQGRGRYAFNPPQLPDLLLLDLNMPKLDGREALRRIKNDPRLRGLPVVILTTSRLEEDVQKCYQMGAASFLSKPATYREWLTLIRDVCTYWFERVRLPGRENL
ncbi:MAG TPA: response regulator [Thermoguttaceae bacterium]|nr:response regulator [Thermoguttaceae bacterium]